MKPLLAIGAVIFAIVAAPAHATTRYISESENSRLYREGVARYSDNNGLVATSWFLIRSKTMGQNLRILMQVHCDTQLIRTIRSIDYYNSQVIQIEDENWTAPWRNPIPNTFEARFQDVCRTR